MATVPHEYVPLCTCADDAERELRLRNAGIDVLESERLVSRKIALVAVLHLEAEDDHVAAAAGAHASPSPTRFRGERGIYVSTHAESLHEQDASALTIILRNVDLHREPFWGSLLVLLSSHFVVARTGPITATSFHALAFLSNYLHIQVLDRSNTSSTPDYNTQLLQAFVPRFTWAAIDLKIKDMDGCESPTKYLEQQLTKEPSRHSVDADAQMLLASLLHTRDCLVLKSTALQPLAMDDDVSGPLHAATASKLLTHVLDNVHVKPFFGRFVTGSILLHLLRSIAAGVAAAQHTDEPFVLERAVRNVTSNYWRVIVSTAFVKYTDTLHARLGVYERAPFSAEYLLDITERKLQTQQIAVVNAGQGKFSAFDEFGNLKRQASVDAHDSSKEDPTSPMNSTTTLNTGIFTFLKNRAERAFTKQFSLFEPSSTTTQRSKRTAAATALTHVPEGLSDDEDDDDDDDDNDSVRCTTKVIDSAVYETPEMLLTRLNKPIQAYAVPITHLHTASESMPVDTRTLERIHAEALKAANAIIDPFLVDLQCLPTSASSQQFAFAELACSIDFGIGKRNLRQRIQRIYRRFVAANDVASAVFCAELVRYLHAIVLSKNDSDREAQKRAPAPLMRRNTLSVLHLAGSDSNNSAPLTKLPIELLAYKSNLEAMVSQYHFVARGPLATRVLIAFFQTTVRSRLMVCATSEYERFDAVCDTRRHKLDELNDALADKQRSVTRAQLATAEQQQQEALALDDVERAHQANVAALRDAIATAETRVASALRDQQALYQSTMHATRKTLNTMDQVVVQNRLFLGYLKRFEKGHLFSKSWRQYYYALDHATLRCYASKSAFEERKPPIEPPVCLSGYKIVESRTDEMKIKLIPPEAGKMLRFRAPVSVGRETWMKRFQDASQLTDASSSSSR